MTMLGDYDLERLLDAIRWQESRGNQNAVSPKGARTAYGIMPATAADPGYGVQPRDMGMLMGDENAARDFSRDYLKAMYDRTGDVNAALASYNGGLGRGLAFKRGGSVPSETANYVPSVMAHYNNGVPGAAPAAAATTPSPARLRFDALMEKFSPVSSAQAAEGPLGTGVGAETFPRPMNDADLTAPGMEMPKTAGFQTNAYQGVMQQGFRPNDPGVLAPDMSPQPVAPPSTVGAPTDITPPAADGPDPYLEQLRSQRIQPSTNKNAWLADAGMAIGAGLLSASGVPVQAGALMGNAVNRRNLDLEERKLNLEQQTLEGAYQTLRDTYRSQGMPDSEAAKKAFIVASNPKLASELGLGGKENFGVNPEYFTKPDGTIVIGQYGDRGTRKFTDLDGNELKGDDLKGLKRDTAIRPIDLPTETVIVDRSGAVLGRFKKDNQTAAQQKQVGQMQGEAAQNLQANLDSSDLALGSINAALEHPGFNSFFGWGAVNPTNYLPGSDYRNFEGLYDQIKGQSFLNAYQGLKGGGAITEVEGKAATAAQARLNQAQSPDTARQAMREMQFLVLQRKARAYINAGQPVPDDVQSQLNIARQYIRDPAIKAVANEFTRLSGGGAASGNVTPGGNSWR